MRFLLVGSRVVRNFTAVGMVFVALHSIAAASASLWQIRDSGTTENLLGAAYADTISARTLVAVGEHGTILTSADDGITWTRRFSGTQETLRSVSHLGGGQFLAVGSGGTILFSTNGVTWTREVSPTALQLNSVSNNLAVGETGVGLLTRNSTGQWTQVATAFSDKTMNQIAANVAVGNGGAVYVGDPNDSTQATWIKKEIGTTADIYARHSFNQEIFVGSDGYGVSNSNETFRAVTVRIGAGFVVVTLGQRHLVGEFFAVGTNGAIYRRAVNTLNFMKPTQPGWVADNSPTHQTLNAVIGASNCVLAFGDAGTILLHPLTAPVITERPVTGNADDGTPYIAGHADSDGAWSCGWLQISAPTFPISGPTRPVGTDYPRQSLVPAPFGVFGVFALIVGNAFGMDISQVHSNRLANVSARANVGAGENVLIAGFSTRGPKRVLVRAVGPGLRAFGIVNPLPAPRVTAYRGSIPIASRPATPENAAAVGAFPLDPSSADQAIVVDLGTGNYSAVVESADGASGVALVEVYDLDPPTVNSLTNLSARANVAKGNDLLIGGIAIDGGVKRKYLVRAVGPTLTNFQIQHPLAHPRLSMYKGATLVRTAGPWNAESDAAEIRTATQAQAFPLIEESADAAMIAPLADGGFSALVSSDDNQSGVALVEVYPAPDRGY